MSKYECVFIARQDLSPAQVEALNDNFKNVIVEQKGNVVYQENWGLRSLAYKINKNRKGHYIMLHIEAPAEAVHEVERLMRINEDVLRYMTIRVEAFDEVPSIMMRQGPKDERPARRHFSKPYGENRSYSKPDTDDVTTSDSGKEESNV